MPLALLGLMLAVAAAAVHYQTRYPREIIGTSTVTLERKTGGRIELKVRRVRIAATEFDEVELPNGTWIGCAGDCRGAVAAATDAFWADQDTRRK